MEKKRLLTRKNIIELWSKQEYHKLNNPCCPDCRDLLYDDEVQNDNGETKYGICCHNYKCDNTDLFNPICTETSDGRYYTVIGKSNK